MTKFLLFFLIVSLPLGSSKLVGGPRRATMQSLTPDQAQQLWNAGGFVILTGLPPGSTVSLDGT